MASWEQGLYFVFHPTPATENEIREMSEALPPDVGENGAAAGLPLIPELETYRAGFRWAKTEILHLTGSLDELTYNRRPRPDAWSAAECVEHLSATARLVIPALDQGIRAARERGWLAPGPFEYGRFEQWFARQAGGEDLPPKRRYRAPRIYRPAHREYEPGHAVQEFLHLQDRYIDALQLASGVDLARTKIASPASRLLRLSLGQWLRAMDSHQRRHLWQARNAIAHPARPAL